MPKPFLNSLKKSAVLMFLVAMTIAIVPLGRMNVLRAAETKFGNSLDLVPADAAFYAATMRIGEQINNLVKSKAWEKLMRMGSVQMAIGAARAEMMKQNGPYAPIKEFFDLEENKPLLELLKDIASDEFFVMGDKQFAPPMTLLNKAYNSGQFSQIYNVMQNFGRPPGQEAQQAQLSGMLYALSEDLDNVKIPSFLMGFKVSKPAVVESQMDRLETILTRLIANAPPVLKNFERTKIDGAPFLSLTVDGGMVPWDQIPWNELEQNAGDLDKLRDKLMKLTLNISLGIKNGYLMLSIGGSNDYIAQLGKGPLLANSDDLGVMKPFLSKSLTSVVWVTKAARAVNSLKKEDLDENQIGEAIEQLLSQTPIDEQVKSRIKDDAKDLATDLKKLIPELGPYLAFQFLNGRGYEGYSYDWAENKRFDSSKPLDLAKNLGLDNPMLFALSRTKNDIGDYDMMVKWMKIAYRYFEDFGIPNIPDQQRGQVIDVVDGLLPIFKNIDTVNRDLLFPAMKDGQGAFLVESKIKSKKWFGEMPEANEELPMLEIGILASTNDSTKLKKAFAEYRNEANNFINVLRKSIPDNEIPDDFKINEPKTRKVNSTDVYYYDMPAAAELDKQLLPHLGVNESYGLFSTSPKMTKRLSEGKSSNLGEFITAVQDKPLASIVHLDFAAWINTIKPWTNYGIDTGVKMNSQQQGLAQMSDFAKNDVGTLLEILACFKSHSSYTTVDSKATITHSQTLIEDLK